MKNTLIAGLSVIALILSVVSISGLFTGERSVIVENLKDLGAVSGPDYYLPYFNNNGIINYSNSVKMNTASTTLCSIKSPTATSTLAFASVRMDRASTSASTITIAQATTAFASTSSIGSDYAVLAAQGVALTASTTDNGGNDIRNEKYIFTPSQYLNVTIKGVDTKGNEATGFTPTGYCKAVFTEL